MHSPSISILKAAPNTVSSTGFVTTKVSGQTKAPRFDGLRSRKTAELLCATKGCGTAHHSPVADQPALVARERTESNKFSGQTRCNSNGKERQISALVPLLNWANTSGIRLFADPQRQSSARTDELVMDRGAEGAARGCDAV